MKLVQEGILLITIFASLSSFAKACVDDDETIARLAEENGNDAIKGCFDIPLNGCKLTNEFGKIIRETCCATCLENSLPVESDLPGTDDTVHVFLQGGQSECGGAGSTGDLVADAATYPTLQDELEGVWFAGYKDTKEPSRFFITPMQAGKEKPTFGPELSFGERYHAVTGKRTLIMKFCLGGTNVHTNWNPDTADNSWDKDADDGTSQWMLDNAGLDLKSKSHLFKSMVYTIRRTQEALNDGGVPFTWAGIIWVQGLADDAEGDPVWKAFCENTARVWNGFRENIGNVPIVDNGSSNNNQLKSGKECATEIVKGCKAINVEIGRGADDETDSSCTITPGNPCTSSPNFHQHPDFYNTYGWDPNVPDELKPEGFVDKDFRWFVDFPNDLHSGYEGMISKGRILANHFILEFTDYNLSSEYVDADPAIQFPSDRCDDGVLPSVDNICWIDHRDESLMADLCTLLDDDEDDDDSSAVLAQTMMGFISSTFILLSMFLYS